MKICAILSVFLSVFIHVNQSIALTENLLKNPGAEEGTQNWPGWDYGAAQSGHDGRYPHSGNRWFWGGWDNDDSGAGQTVDVSKYATIIDAGGVKAIWGGWLSAYATNNDPAELAIGFFNSSNVLINNRVYWGGRYGNAYWHLVAYENDVPVNTRKITFWLRFWHRSGGDNDGYIDDVYLKLKFPNFQVSSPDKLDFGNLYLGENQSASNYNRSAKKQISFSKCVKWWINPMLNPVSIDNQYYTILDENADAVVAALTSGSGAAAKTTESYTGNQALGVIVASGDKQKYNAQMPGWNFSIVANPQAPNEFRYLTFAWQKDGGTGIQMQLNGNPGGWSHRYHAGASAWTPSVRVSDLPEPGEWLIQTVDLHKDWGAFTLTGIALSPIDGNAGLWDHIYLHKNPELPYPAWINLSKQPGVIRQASYDKDQEVSVWLDIPSQGTGDYSGNISLNTTNGSRIISVRAIAHPVGEPPVCIAPDFGSNSKVNVPVNKSVKFKIEPKDPVFPGATVNTKKTLWKKVTGNDPPDSGFEVTTDPEKNYSYDDAGDYTVYARWIDSNGVESDILAIPVRAWNLPVVNDSPPQPGNVSWYNGKYVGVRDEPVRLMAGGEKGSSMADERISKFLWDLDNNWDTIELEQPAGSFATYTWSTPGLNGRIRCKAVTNYGIQSDEKLFDLKIYDSLSVDADGPYVGRPTKPVELKGSVNRMSYPGAIFKYQWKAQKGDAYVDVDTDIDGKAKYTWNSAGDYEVRITAIVTTGEGFELTGESVSVVKIEAGRPTAMPGGPYRGGIAGGNFSPIQFMGNLVGFVEAEDIGAIQNWVWTFRQIPAKQNGDNNVFPILDENANELIGLLTEGGGTAKKAVGDVNSGKEALMLDVTGDAEKYNPDLPGWVFNIVENPVNPNEFRFITFAWRKDGGNDIQLQLNGDPGGWEHRYHAGENVNSLPSISISEVIPDGWMVVTRDLFNDFGEFTITGIRFSAFGGNAGFWDDIFLHKTPKPPIITVQNIWNPTHAYEKLGKYTVSLRVLSEYGKWSFVDTASVQVIDGRIAGYVRAADLRTPVKEARVVITSSHIDPNALEASAMSANPPLNTDTLSSGEFAIYTLTDSKGYYAFEHIPLGNYRVIVSKTDGDTIHDFETSVKATELTLDAPNQPGIDFTDLSVFPISGRIAYSIKKNGVDVLVEDVVVEAQAVGSTNSIKSLPSGKALSATGGNYSLPLFSGKYLFITNRQGHDIRIKEGIPNYDSAMNLITIDRARTDIDFVDYTSYSLTVFVKDSGDFKIPGKDIIVSGDNGQAEGKSDAAEGKFTAVLPPGKYTVTVPGAEPETKEVDMTGGDRTATMIIPVKIVLSVGPKPKFFDASDDFLSQFGLKPEDNPEGYMYYYPPEPRKHTYTITATANGNPVGDFKLFVTDEISIMTEDAPVEQATMVSGEKGEYIISAGKPKMNIEKSPPLAAPKRVTFRAEKDGYLSSDTLVELVTVLGDVSVGTAAKIISIPYVNYLVLHDPPGDGSSSYIDDSMTIKGIINGMTIKVKEGENESIEIPVYPSPWSEEREGADKGLLGYKEPYGTSAAGHYTWMAATEAVTGALMVGLGPVGYAAHLIKSAITLGLMQASVMDPKLVGGGGWGLVQYEVSPSRQISTSSGADIRIDLLPDVAGPGKGDVYFGEGWTLGLQTKYRLGIKQTQSGWELSTDEIETYDILETSNQYIYSVRDIKKIIADLEKAIKEAKAQGNTDEEAKLKNAKKTWDDLLNKNLAYVYNRDYVSQGRSFEEFKNEVGSELGDSEMIVFSAGPGFEYSRKISEGTSCSVSYELSTGYETGFGAKLKTTSGFEAWGSGVKMEWDIGATLTLSTSTSFGSSWENGQQIEQTIGFELGDDDVGDNIATYVYADPVWGTPLFFVDPGSYTSDPWEAGTNKNVDLKLELLDDDAVKGPFDYKDGAHYTIKVTYTGQRDLDSIFQTIDFNVYAPQTDNKGNMTVIINGGGDTTVVTGLTKESPIATIAVSLYPPEKDQDSTDERQYEVDIVAQETNDLQIARILKLKPKFADLRAPRANIIVPYSHQRVSPVLFPQTDPFDIQVFTNDMDVDSIQLQIRAKQPDGMWEPWRNLDGMLWKDGKVNNKVTVFDRLNQEPQRREFTFKWIESEIRKLGVGEYDIRAVASDKRPNTDIDPPGVVFMVDDSKPSVLTSLPDYQARESERIYRGELSVIFTDDMRSDDFTDRTFSVVDLLKGSEKVAGFVSYSSTLRKAIFVPVVPFSPNGFYRVEIRTDTMKNNTKEPGVHDLAGNPLDNAFMWTFRTTDTPFEETWSITLSVTDGTSTDANNIASVEFGAMDGEDDKDARAVPSIASRLRMSFVNRDKEEFDRDARPADGRLSHHWFFIVGNASNGADVTIKYKPSIKLTRTERQYQDIWLMEFDANGTITQRIKLNPAAAFNSSTGEIEDVVAYTYKNAGEAVRYFRLDVQKASLVAKSLNKGSSEWKFFSVPIAPQRADPFVNLGDDIEPFQLFRYDARLNGYKIYPLDIGEVSLQTGRGYFTRLKADTDIDVGGTSNVANVNMTLENAGWHAIGNPFILPVNVTNLRFNGQAFNNAVTAGLVEGTLYRWKTTGNLDAYEAVTNKSRLEPWEGYWIRTKQDNVKLRIPPPAGLANAIADLPDSYDPPMAPPIENPEDKQFSLGLKLFSDTSSDITTTLGTCQGAEYGYDAFDQSEPPVLGQTVSLYFDHSSSFYNYDYQPVMKVGEERIWKVTAYTDKPDQKMTLSWSGEIPGDIMLYFRKAEYYELSSAQSEWEDMRKARAIELSSRSQIARIPIEIRALRFDMSPLSDISLEADEENVTLRWKHENNDFVDSFIVVCQSGGIDDWKDGEGDRYTVSSMESELIDRRSEDSTYTYQLGVRFKSEAELMSKLFTVKTMPKIKKTVLLQNYPNPFNPEVWIPYELADQLPVRIQIYNQAGLLVRTLDLGTQLRGRYTSKEKAAYWDGRTETGERAASGVYFYMLRAGEFNASSKMVLVK